MSEITVFEKYQLPEFIRFYSEYNFLDERAKHTAYLVMSYYHFSYHQMIALQSSMHEWQKKDPSWESPSTADFYLNKSWSHAYGMYALLRTSLESLRILRKMLSDETDISQYWQKKVVEIIDIANDTVKHPMFKHGVLSTGTQPNSLDIACNIDVVVTDSQGNHETKELKPMNDFESIRNYIEYIAKRFTE